MISIRTSLATVAACGLLFSAVAPAFAGPKDYQITGDVVSVNDTTITIKKGKDAPWEIGRDASTKGADTLKPGDHITVHYTMTAGVVELPTGTAKDKKAPAAATGKASKKAKADTATEPTASGSPSKPAAEAASPTP